MQSDDDTADRVNGDDDQMMVFHACSGQTCTMGQVSLSSALNRPDGEQLQRTSMCLTMFSPNALHLQQVFPTECASVVI